MTPTFVLAVLIKGLLVLSIALGLSLLFRRASAAARHGVWVAAFVALLALPLLEAMGPKWSVPVGPMPSAVEGVLAPMAPTPPVPPAPPAPPEVSVLAMGRHAAQLERQAALLELQAERLAAQAARDAEVSIRQLERQLEQVGVAHRQVHVQSSGGDARIVLASSQAPVIKTIRSVPREIVLAVLWFWGLGALMVALAWAVAYAAAARAVRMGTLETDEDRLATWERVRLLSGVARPVRLLRSPALDVPIAWGWGDAAVVLPESADDWDDDRLEAVLLHELAHILRGDAVTQLIAQIALVLHWANPLAWLAYRKVLLEREHACDDVVIEHGARPSAYADHLVQVARDLRRRSAALAAVAPMARHSHLEGRVLSILDPSRKRAALSRTAGATLMLLLCAISMPVAALQLTSGPEACDSCEEPVTMAVAAEPAPEAPVAVARPTSPLPPGVEPDPLALEIEEVVASVEAIELAMYDEPEPTIQLALDTIPRFDDVIRPALEAALEAVHAMRTSERHDQLNLSSEDWEEMEEGIRDAIEDARENYDEAIEEAIEEALEDMEDEDWEVSWSDQPDGARVGGYTSDEALDRARRDVERAQRDARRALKDVQRDLQRQLRRSERRQHTRNWQSETQNRVRAQNRARTDTRQDTRRSNGQGYSYSYSVSDNGAVVSQSSGSGASGWVSGLDGLNKGLDSIEQSLSNLERADGEANHGALAGLSAGLVGIQNGLSSIAGAAQSSHASNAEKRVVKEHVLSTRDRLHALQERIEDCSD